ncbi:transposase [Leptothermofonsia sichuanensis]
MRCPECGSTDIRKNDRKPGEKNHICIGCGRQFTDLYDPLQGHPKPYFLRLKPGLMLALRCTNTWGSPHTGAIPSSGTPYRRRYKNEFNLEQEAFPLKKLGVADFGYELSVV